MIECFFREMAFSAKAIPHTAKVARFDEIDFRYIVCTIGYSFHHTSATRVSISEGRCKKYGRTKKDFSR